MHEYGLATDIARGVAAEAARAGRKRLSSLDVEVGGLTRLDRETLSFWLEEALGGEGIDAGRIRVIRTPLTLTCLHCGGETNLPDDDDLVALDPFRRRCPECRSEDVKLSRGSGWHVEVEWADPE